MNMVFITPTPPDINAFGVRILSSVLKANGINTKIIFLPGGIERLKFNASFIYQYENRVLEQIADICADASFIGISFMSQYFDRAVQITEFLKKRVTAPIIWGGIHPTYRPKQSLMYSDSVCIGEGETAIVEYAKKIAAGEDYTKVKGCWHVDAGNIITNPANAIIQDLDTLPYVDYDIKDHYVYSWTDKEVVKIDDEIMKSQFLRMKFHRDVGLITYRTMTSRGCPHRCAYCASSAMQRLRRRSVDNVIDELKIIIKRFQYIELVSFFDDTFFAASVEYFEEFRDKYKAQIGLPFHAQCSPSTISEKKMELLVDAGLFYTEMGIQTGSLSMKKMYRRDESNKTIIKAATIIESYRPRLMIPDYHIILDNPWESIKDVEDTLELLLRLPGKFRLQLSSLVLFPGTELNEKAILEGIITDEISEVCRKPFTFPKENYLNYLIFISGFPVVSRTLLKFMSKDFFIKIFHSTDSTLFFRALFWLTLRFRLIVKGLRAVFARDFKKIRNYFKLVR